MLGTPTQYLCDCLDWRVRLPSICIVIGANGYAYPDNAAKDEDSKCWPACCRIIRRGKGVRVGRGRMGKRPREDNDEHVDDLYGQGNDQGMRANRGVEGVNGNVEGVNGGVEGATNFSMIIAQQLHNLLLATLAQEFLACNLKEYDGKGGAVVLTRWIKKMENVFMMIEEFCPSYEMQKLETEFWNHAMVGADHAAYTDRFHELARLAPHLVSRGSGSECVVLVNDFHRLIYDRHECMILMLLSRSVIVLQRSPKKESVLGNNGDEHLEDAPSKENHKEGLEIKDDMGLEDDQFDKPQAYNGRKREVFEIRAPFIGFVHHVAATGDRVSYFSKTEAAKGHTNSRDRTSCYLGKKHNSPRYHIESEDGNPARANVKEALGRSYALSWKPCKGDSLNLHDHSKTRWCHVVASTVLRGYLIVSTRRHTNTWLIAIGIWTIIISMSSTTVGNKMHKAFPLPLISSHCQKKFPLLVRKVPLLKRRDATAERIALLLKTEMEHSNTTPAKIPILDTGKYEQWKFRIQQYLQNEHYALWEVIKFGDSYEVPKESAATGSASDEKKGRTIAITTEDMQKRRNNVKARTTLLLALSDEHQLRFSKYKMDQELWAAILKTFSGNEATRKTKKNLLKQQYGNFKAKGKETLAPEWLMHTIVWRNRSDLDTMSLDDLYNHLKVYEPEVQKKSDYQNIAFISSSKNSSGNEEDNNTSVPTASTQVSPAGPTVTPASISLDTACAYTTSQSNGSQIKYEDINQIDEDDIEEMDIKRDNYKQGSKVEEQAPKALMAINRVGWEWSYMENDEENHALVADEEAPTEFALMAKTSTDSEVFDNSLCSKACLSQVEGRLVEFKDQEIKFCEKIKGLESVECKTNRIENLTNELETLKKEKEGLESKLTGFKSATKDLDNLIGSQRSEKIKEGLGYSAVPPPAQVYCPYKKDISSSASKNGDSTGSILSKPEIKFVKPADSPTVVKTYKKETVRKPTVKYAELYRKTSKSSNACYNYSSVDHLSYDYDKWVDHGRSWAKNNNTHKSRTPRIVFYKTGRPPMRTNRPYMNAAQLKRTSFYKPAHSYLNRPFQRTSAVRSQFRGPRVLIVNRKFPTVNKKFPTSNSRFSTADVDNKGTAVKASACWIWKPTQNLSNKGPNSNSVSVMSKKYTQGGCKITGKGTIKTGKLEFKNVYFVKDLKLGHLNIKTMNKLVRHNLVRGLPSKCFENDHTYVACLKGKQHKASCKTKLVNSVTKPLHTLRMDLFGPTSISSLNHKWYCLVVTDDFSRFTWTFFLKTKDETSGILRNFITEIENLKELRVKIIRCDNKGEFRNMEMNDFCSRKGIKREFSNARTPQQNRVAERRNRTLIELARTMLADAKLPVTFWAKAVNTACYVQNMVLVNKSQNKTPYELFNGRTPAIGFLKPFGCHVIILNTLDNLGKFEAKGDEGYFIGCSMSSKALEVLYLTDL
uniref:Retrovirus-related Pol polyprotein from transposon TNT 1-94 n=1 Tax=Tanacetum cinerariifolium TaxID=118510 RepID=A0A6L2M9R2_TANCI|nr:retrovirus-related Pol polyprotein from transposon TNT 1-94 [Tanacetum cinerariifolium]